MQEVKVLIRGVTPLLINRITEEAAETATRGTRRAVRSSERLTPREDAESRLHLNDEKKVCIPSYMLGACLKSAGTHIRVGRNKLSTQRNSLVPSWILFHEMDFPIDHEQPWSVDSRPIRNPVTGGVTLRYRPRFDDWSVQLNFFLNEVLELGGGRLARELFDIAGSVCGLGDYRIGSFGRWRVDEWKEV